MHICTLEFFEYHISDKIHFPCMQYLISCVTNICMYLPTIKATNVLNFLLAGDYESTPIENTTIVLPTATAIRGIPRRAKKSKSRTICGGG